MGDVGVFVSYNHKDRKIAEALVEAFAALSDRFEAFIDYSGIDGGDLYEVKIAEAIAKSQWFILICSDSQKSSKNMNWCFYEAGQFRSKLLGELLAYQDDKDKHPESENRLSKVKSKMTYLYDGENPSQLASYQGAKVSAISDSGATLKVEDEDDDSLEYERTPLFSLFSQFLEKSGSSPLKNVAEANTRKFMRSGVRKVTAAFLRNIVDEVIDEVVFQPRVCFQIPVQSGQDGIGLSEATSVYDEDKHSIEEVFGLIDNPTTWGRIKKEATNAIHNTEPLWILDVENAAREIAAGRKPTQTSSTLVTTNSQFVIPILSRIEKFRSGAKKCYIAFLPARDRKFASTQKTSLLISALILCIRFRQKIMPLIEEISKAQPKPAKLIPLLSKFKREVINVEMESIEFGLTPPDDPSDEPPLLNAFRDGVKRETMRNEIRDWNIKRNEIFSKIDTALKGVSDETSPEEVAKYIVDSLSGLREINGFFIETISEELLYVEKIEAVPK